ncbi:MAG: GntR family transcriptional regulator [Chloroflexota bacterium]
MTEIQARPFSKSIPLYLQIAETFAGRIVNGELKPNDRLPAERELCKMLRVSRMTLRQALRELEGRGMIYRRQGDGTYVAEPKIERTASKLVAFTDAMRQKGYVPAAKIIVFETRFADESLARQLEIPFASPIYVYHRLRMVNMEPLMLEICYLPLSRFPGLEQFDMENRSVYEILRTEFGVSIDHSIQSLEAVLAGDYEAALLGIAVGSPLMLQRRLAYDRDNVPIETGEDYYRGDRFRFVTDSAPFALEE